MRYCARASTRITFRQLFVPGMDQTAITHPSRIRQLLSVVAMRESIPTSSQRCGREMYPTLRASYITSGKGPLSPAERLDRCVILAKRTRTRTRTRTVLSHSLRLNPLHQPSTLYV
ncbi:hypothetical protein CBOM_07872 [Ceraceosorus bombacis]|uniref:Uncharacterized protein n=1 Tax=Ceraceosorus bombacis TaxID=401625 RepID=A0A0P1BII5_9BASI|nr:hypothetical protein CBOM_07872 [Ceraceosorus bombacis]